MTGAVPIGVAIAAVPDGIRIEAGKRYLRLSLSLTPNTQSRAQDLILGDLAKWPTEIARATKDQLRLAVGKLTESSGAYTLVGARTLGKTFSQDAAAKYVSDAQKLWDEIFSPVGFDALYRGLDAEQGQASNPFGVTNGEIRHGVADIDALSSFAKVVYGYSTERSIVSRLLKRASRRAGAPLPASFYRPNLTVHQRRLLHTHFLSLAFEKDLKSDLPRDVGAPTNEAVRQEVLDEMKRAGSRLIGAVSETEAAAIDQEYVARRQESGRQLAAFAAKLRSSVSRVGQSADTMPPPADFKEVRKEIARLGILARPSDDDSCDRLTPEQAALRKLSSIIAYPTLAKFLGLIIDIDVEADELLRDFGTGGATPRVSGAVAAFVKETPADPDPDFEELQWSAFTCRGAGSAPAFVPAYFGPCPRNQLSNNVGRNEELKDGLIDLTVPSASDANQRRFKLETMDAEKTIQSIASANRSLSFSDRAGVLERDQPEGEPEIIARGIQLRDTDVQPSLAGESDLARKNTQRALNGDLLVNFAEDYMLGVSVDCAVVSIKKNADGDLVWDDWTRIDHPDKVLWRPMTARTLNYPKLPSKFISDVADYKFRDDGHVRRSVSKKVTTQKGTSGTDIQVQQTLFSWVGEGLGVPPAVERSLQSNQSSDTIWPDPEQDLAIDMTFDLPVVGARMLPPLREGYGYVFGARAYYVNGCGLTLQEALPKYAEKDQAKRITIGAPDRSGADQPFLFRRHTRIGAPTTLLPWNEPIVSAVGPLNGEAIDTLVVRSTSPSTARARRYLVPPQSSFTAGEQGGVFDKEDATTGAYVAQINSVRAQLAEDGSFPIAKRPNSGNSASDEELSLGLKLVLNPRARSPKIHHYPDPLARRFTAEFCLTEEGVTFEQLPAPVEFWRKAKTCIAAQPVLLELRRGQRGGPRFRFDTSDNTADVEAVDHSTYNVKKLAVVLAPAEQVQLRLWSMPDPEKVVKAHAAFADAIKGLSEGRVSALTDLTNAGIKAAVILEVSRRLAVLPQTVLANTDSLADEIEAILLEGAIANVQTDSVLNLVHAVPKPLEKPFFVKNPGGEDQNIKLRAIVIRGVGGGGNADQLLAAWSDYVKQQSAINPDPMAWSSEEGGSVAFFVGRANVHRPSVGKLRCEFDTVEYGTQTVKRKNGVFEIDTTVRSWGRSIRIEDVPTSESLRNTEIDLLYADTLLHPDVARTFLQNELPPNALRGLSAAVGDGKAHHLRPTLYATSRFTNFFPDKPRTGLAGPYEEVGEVGKEGWIWIPATSRPSRPAIDRILPLFHWNESRLARASTIEFSRETSLRIYADSDKTNPQNYWWSSGEGEKLGVVCWPANLLSSDPSDAHCSDEHGRLTFEQFSEAVGEAARFVTRLGADPISLSGAPEDIIPADRIRGMDLVKDRLRLPIINTGIPLQPSDGDEPGCVVEQDTNNGLLVSIAAYEPKVDKKTGELFFDVTIDPGASHQPLVQLGLVRYQPHAVKDFELSEPITKGCHLIPKRNGKISFVNDKELVLEFYGVGFHRRELGPGHDDVRHLADRPLLNVRLMRAVEPNAMPHSRTDQIEWLPVIDNHGKPIEWLRQVPRAASAEMSWLISIKLPKSRDNESYGLLLEEVELVAADNVPQAGWDKPEDINFSTIVVERGPLFSHVVHLSR